MEPVAPPAASGGAGSGCDYAMAGDSDGSSNLTDPDVIKHETGRDRYNRIVQTVEISEKFMRSSTRQKKSVIKKIAVPDKNPYRQCHHKRLRQQHHQIKKDQDF